MAPTEASRAFGMSGLECHFHCNGAGKGSRRIRKPEEIPKPTRSSIATRVYICRSSVRDDISIPRIQGRAAHDSPQCGEDKQS
jgi:hypothetical protein